MRGIDYKYVNNGRTETLWLLWRGLGDLNKYSIFFDVKYCKQKNNIF